MDLETLDDEWIKNFDKIDKVYEDFYKDDLYYVNLRVIYVNINNEIDKITNESLLFNNPNYVLQEELIGILKRLSIINDRRYSLLSILKYNITLNPEEVENYLKNRENKEYLTIIKNIDTIKFEKTINMFHDLNDLIFVFYEKDGEKIIKKSSQGSTRRIKLGSLSSNKKTIRKRYKDNN